LHPAQRSHSRLNTKASLNRGDSGPANYLSRRFPLRRSTKYSHEIRATLAKSCCGSDYRAFRDGLYFSLAIVRFIGPPSSLVQLRIAVWTGGARDTRPIPDMAGLRRGRSQEPTTRRKRREIGQPGGSKAARVRRRSAYRLVRRRIPRSTGNFVGVWRSAQNSPDTRAPDFGGHDQPTSERRQQPIDNWDKLQRPPGRPAPIAAKRHVRTNRSERRDV
jgi:hypothetical protein